MMCDWCVTSGVKKLFEAEHTVITGTLPNRVDTWFLCDYHVELATSGKIHAIPGYKGPYQIDEHMIGPLPPTGR